MSFPEHLERGEKMQKRSQRNRALPKGNLPGAGAQGCPRAASAATVLIFKSERRKRFA